MLFDLKRLDRIKQISTGTLDLDEDRLTLLLTYN